MASQEHLASCRQHDPIPSEPCFGLTARGVRCSRTVGLEGHLCFQHRDQTIRVRICEVAGECGERCGRSSCSLQHQHPCILHSTGDFRILDLPTEIRHMIIRNLFPEVIPATRDGFKSWSTPKTRLAILHVDRTLSTDTKTVLWREIPFEVKFNSHTIFLLGRKCIRAGGNLGPDLMDFEYSVAHLGITPWLKNIRNFRISVVVPSTQGLDRWSAFGSLRDCIRHFVQNIERANDQTGYQFRRMEITVRHQNNGGVGSISRFQYPIVGPSLVWDAFSNIHGVLTPYLRVETMTAGPSSWNVVELPRTKHQEDVQAGMKHRKPDKVPSGVNKLVKASRQLLLKAEREYLKIDRFVSALVASPLRGGFLLVKPDNSRLFRISDVMSSVKKAREYGDVGYLKRVHKTLSVKWLFRFPELQSAFPTITAETCDMDYYKWFKHYRDAFENVLRNSPHNFERAEAQNYGVLREWPYFLENDIPEKDETGVTYAEDDVREYFKKDNRIWIRLKT